MIKWVCLAAAGLVVLTACPQTRKADQTGPSSAASPGANPSSSGSSIELDGGALRVDRVSSRPTTISRKQAADDFVKVRTLAKGPVVPILGRVTTSIGADDLRFRRLKNLKGLLAWVYIAYLGAPPASCPGFYAPQPLSSATASHAWVVIVDAKTGRGYSYKGVGAGFCGVNIVPDLSVAGKEISVPWSFSNHRFRVQIPPCGVYESAHFQTYKAGAYRPLTLATAYVLIKPCREAPTVYVLTVTGKARPAMHAPLGYDCFPVSDPAFPRPADCLGGNP